MLICLGCNLDALPLGSLVLVFWVCLGGFRGTGGVGSFVGWVNCGFGLWFWWVWPLVLVGGCAPAGFSRLAVCLGFFAGLI